MMREKQSCAVIKDLLPLYMDQLTSEDTNEIIKEHLNECNSCNELYRCMSADIEEEKKEPNVNKEAVKEIDYLKKIRKNSRKKVLCAVGAAVFVLLAVTIVKIFVYGAPCEQYTSSILVDGDTVKIQGVINDAKKAYSHYKVIENDGEKQLVIYAASSLWNRDRSFEINYSLDKAKEQGLLVENRKVTTSGEVISTLAARIYANKHPYIGDASKNGALAYAMGIGEDLGNFTSELQTEKEPYGWTLQFERVLEESNEALFNEKMRGYAYVLLATVGNVDEITWSYVVKTEDGGKQKKVTVTALEAEGILGQDLKAFAESEEQVEALLMKVGLSPIGSSKSELKEYQYRLTLTGRMPNAESDTTFVVLTDRKGLTFDEVAKSLYSNNSEDWLDDVVIASIE